MEEDRMEQQMEMIAKRIKGMRTLLEISVREMAEIVGVTEEEYTACEEGRQDFSFTFLFKCANAFGVDITELVTGDVPKLSFFTLVRKGDGMPIERRQGFRYRHLAYLMKNRLCEPFVVTARYSDEEQEQPIHLSTHRGQEFDYILSGSLKVQLENHVVIMNEGDSIYYDSSRGHGMIAAGGKDCVFLAVVIKEEE